MKITIIVWKNYTITVVQNSHILRNDDAIYHQTIETFKKQRDFVAAYETETVEQITV